jgi:hypothetical protein
MTAGLLEHAASAPAASGDPHSREPAPAESWLEPGHSELEGMAGALASMGGRTRGLDLEFDGLSLELANGTKLLTGVSGALRSGQPLTVDHWPSRAHFPACLSFSFEIFFYRIYQLQTRTGESFSCRSTLSPFSFLKVILKFPRILRNSGVHSLSFLQQENESQSQVRTEILYRKWSGP